MKPNYQLGKESTNIKYFHYIVPTFIAMYPSDGANIRISRCEYSHVFFIRIRSAFANVLQIFYAKANSY